MYDKVKSELTEQYRSVSAAKISRILNPYFAELDAFAAANPELSAVELKEETYRSILRNAKPHIAPHSPFFGEVGLKASEYDGRCELSLGGWLLTRRIGMYEANDPVDYEHYIRGSWVGLHLAYGPYCDYDHHSYPLTDAIRFGLKATYDKVVSAHAKCEDENTRRFYSAAEEGLLAVKAIAEKFAGKAEEMLETESDPEVVRNLRLIADTAKRVPWNAPESFYDGLAASWFLHEIGSIMDGVGNCLLGHPDKQLIDLYNADIASGAITRDEAKRLISIYLLHTDLKVHHEESVARQYNMGEQGDTLILGGTNEDGTPIFNELTRLFSEAHSELGLIYPKIHIRVSKACPRELLEIASVEFVKGRNVLSFLNDDVIIPAQVKFGKRYEDVVNYLAGGCWEIIVDGCEHSEGANCYFSLGKAIEMMVYAEKDTEVLIGLDFKAIDKAATFDELYEIVISNVKQAIGQACSIIAKNGAIWPNVNPAPFFSVSLADTIENGKDYSKGGARYNPHSFPLTGISIFVNSLIAIDEICFKNKEFTVADFAAIVRSNWDGHEALRKRVTRLEHFGDGLGRAADLAARILKELADFISAQTNERGGRFQPGLYSYNDVLTWANLTRATPDGKREGEFLSPGLTPSRTHAADPVGAVFSDIAKLPLDDYPANSVLTISLASNGMKKEHFSAIIRTWIETGAGGHLQPNVISKEDLEDAMVNPDAHKELIVRLYGYSARFVSLTPDMQKEFLSRTIYG